MKYYATIYIDEFLEYEILVNLYNGNGLDFTHAFLGLTKDKSPDELDKIDEQLRQGYLKNKEWNKIDQKWYETKEPNEFNDDFWGFGTGIANVAESLIGTPGKVFNNNQYVLDSNIDKNCYIIKKLRSPQTFKPSNRCTLELSKEQYESLLVNIKADFEATKEITPNSEKPINEEFTYKLLENNCVTWVIRKLSDIGIELIDDEYKVPGNLIDIFGLIKSLHSIFLKFQNIDDNLQSVKGARAFITWTRSMLYNNYICYVNQENLEKKIQTFCKKNIENQRYYESIKKFYNEISQLKSIYNKLDFCLESITKKFNTSIKGDFELIYFDRKDRQIKLLKADNDYEAIAIQDLDLSQKYNNFSVSKFYPFIFIPKNEMISRMLYHKYDYGNIPKEYQKDRNEFYFNVLAGEKSDKYWSSSYHKMTKNLRKIHAS
ncbi:hypothetical protein [Campylobacter insulaenigrae]|uniref:hypothetical protein n=1 Tax=Campylobacter insulaenigrae TaxID=260714 RepID=UPI0021535EBF|nr:hypothetical protein [Campylobacter insulaenigrae]MCR6577711.1 hypothetical protein [Campylobacter insulaenigrae]